MHHPHLTREALVIVADLGRLRAFKVVRRGHDPQERDHLEASLPQPCHQLLSNTLGADLTKELLAKLEERFFPAG